MSTGDSPRVTKDQVEEWLGKEVADFTVESMAGAGGLNGDMMRVRVVVAGAERRLVVKMQAADRTTDSKNLGLAREGVFLGNEGSRAAKAGVTLPGIVHARGDMSTGEKVIAMEDLGDSAIQSGYFFGAHSPLNWGKDVADLTSAAPHVSPKILATGAALAAARLHAAFWGDKEVLGEAWVRGGGWLEGKEESAWQAGMDMISGAWAAVQASVASGEEGGVKWDAELLEYIGSAMERSTFDAWTKALSEGQWTLIHGDFHPANMLLKLAAEEGAKAAGEDMGKAAAAVAEQLVLLDWEVVGVGFGARELAQYLISHVAPESRRTFEDDALRAYYNELQLVGGEKLASYSFEACKQDYVLGGLGRWIWLLLLLTTMCPPPMTQYFHDQVLAFAKDHGFPQPIMVHV
jgi:hypothetical protein